MKREIILMNAFMTIHDKNFVDGQYLYHYSSFEKAVKIITSDRLRFGNPYGANDTTEYKPKVVCPDEEIYNYLIEMNKRIKMCCFSQDNLGIRKLSKKNNDYYVDHIGRGFALPRMWAQYGDNNTGVCFIFNKHKMLEYIAKSNVLVAAEPISYEERYQCVRLKKEDVTELRRQSKEFFRNGNTDMCDFLNGHLEYVRKNYFTKLKDWKNENEYRIILFSTNGDPIFVPDLHIYLEGIVLGENAEEINKSVLLKLLDKKVPIKRVIFQCTSIILK